MDFSGFLPRFREKIHFSSLHRLTFLRFSAIFVFGSILLVSFVGTPVECKNLLEIIEQGGSPLIFSHGLIGIVRDSRIEPAECFQMARCIMPGFYRMIVTEKKIKEG